MSRIPRIGKTFGSKENEDQCDAAKKEASNNYAHKRLSEDELPTGFKKPRTNGDLKVTKKVSSSVQSTLPKSRLFEMKAKAKSVLQRIPDPGLVRCSMPAVTSTSDFKIPKIPKRPAWDLKGRIQDMESSHKMQLETYNQRISALERTLFVKSELSEAASSRVQDLETKLKQKDAEIKRLNQEISDLQNMHQAEISSLKARITSLTCLKSEIQEQLDTSESMLKKLKSLCDEKDSKIEALLKQNSDLDAKIREGESLRRKLHNTILDLKGNIRVFCRLRPPLSEEVKNGMILANIVPVSEKAIEINQLPDVGLNESTGKIQPKYEFSFDMYFPSSASQESVFSEISQLVQSALDGYNVCIFAYGQTGSGKTFTMEGPPEIEDFVANKNHPNLGMIPRSVLQIFSAISELEPNGWKYMVQTLFLEIYNEKIQDLLNQEGASTKCEIVKSNEKGNCIVSNVTAVDVSSAEQVFELMKKARRTRAVAATKCNEHSSRSHFVFQMKIHGENSFTSEKCEATLNLVDLAGSERIKDSESVGHRLTEAKAINKSLSALGKVLMSLCKKDNHIPYRDSKLTHLLANSLGGNSKTLMFVNVSPDSKNIGETLNSLRFATKVNQCVIGAAHRKIK